MNGRRPLARLGGFALPGAVLAAMAVAPGVAQADVWGTNFESSSYTAGQDIDGQSGWSSFGPYDANVVNVSGYANASGYGFGGKALQISNFTTLSSFGDQTFTPSVADEAGESIADSGGASGGIRQTQFNARFRIGVADPSDPTTTDRHTTVSPDRGDGARMSYLRFEDHTNGIHVFFVDVNADDSDFPETDIATLDRTRSHLVELSMTLVDGPANDVVKVSIDGALVHTGTSWEQYFLLDTEQAPAGNKVPTVDSLLIREAGTANASQQGKGFLLDDFRIETTTPGANTGPAGATGAAGTPGPTGAPGPAGPTGPAGAGTPASEGEVTPVVITSTVLKPDSKGRVAVKLSCPKAAGLCDGRLGLAAGRKLLGGTTFLLNGGKSGTVRVKLSPKLLKAAIKAKKVKASVFSRDSLGKASQTSATLKFRKR
jgi:hypothetical protein